MSEQSEPINRLDPPGCGCTDCITGWSRPLDEATEQELMRGSSGAILNFSGQEISSYTARCYYCGLANPGPEHNAHAPMLCSERGVRAVERARRRYGDKRYKPPGLFNSMRRAGRRRARAECNRQGHTYETERAFLTAEGVFHQLRVCQRCNASVYTIRTGMDINLNGWVSLERGSAVVDDFANFLNA